MIRLNWLITLLFFVPCTMSNNYVTPHTGFTRRPHTGFTRRPCPEYNRCARTYTPPVDVLPANSSMGYDASLRSNETSFTTGFFVRGNNSYLGTWYTMSDDMIVVWVANRDNPIPSQTFHNCSLVLGKDGNAAIVVLDSENHYYSYWSTAYSATSNPAMTYLQLLDNGNLVLREKGDEGGKYLWQSFEHPTDTFLPGMNISQGSLNFISWKSPEDPATGHFLLKIRQGDASLIDLLMYDTDTSYNSTPLWDSILSSLDPILNDTLLRIEIEEGYEYYSPWRLVLNETGRLQLWELENNKWSMLSAAPKDQCDFYDQCGSFGVCDAGTSLKCKCLPGYQPNDPVKWDSKNFSSGCSKKTNDQYGGIFYNLPMVKLPSDPIISNETHCRNTCLNSCGCKGYSFDADQYRCLIWRDELKRIEEYNDVANASSLYVRISHSDIESSSRSCNICGTNVIPYPLSTNGSCGDPTYFNFLCNDTNGQLYFIPPNGKAYRVSNINPDQRKFTLELVAPSVSTDKLTNNIDQSTELNLNNSSPFKVTTCNVVGLMDRTVTEVEVSWKPPLQPTCNSSADCKDWPETSCGLDADGEKVCMCVDGFQWDSLSMNCSKVHHKPLPLLVKVGIASGTVLFLLSGISFVIHLQRRKVTPRAGIVDQFQTDDIEDTEIPLVDYQSILAATDNFSDANKLGAGGFGPVYKGVLVDGNEVAVKRLSAASVQGVQEFRNEIILIAKLQHRNLVRVLGYCISEDEKILIYEYMPNKSLDSCLFDRTMPCLLDWTKRFNIILGIARGLLYLHEDSRLRIIHRDLKPSNILLDEELNPKISDFGLAKIIAGNDMATNTARVVGTYGYMSPEYALEGYFSVKSDVYSFGIIVFEVISGKRCTSLLPLENSLINLLGYAWDLWKQEKELELVDKSIIDTCDSFQVKRFINVALLCVQENPSDRPTVSSALLMLGGDNMNLPYPKQPVFVARRQPSVTNSSSKFGTSMGSNVELTNTLEGR